MTVARKESTYIVIIEKFGLAAVALLLCFRIFLNTQLDIFLLSGITLLAVFYLWFGFFLFTNAIPIDMIDKKKRSVFTPFKITSSIVMGVVYSISLISILYAIFFYPRMQFMLGFSFLLLAVSTSLLAVYHWLNKNEYPYLIQYYKRSLIMGSFVLFILIVPVETRLEILYRDHPGFIEAYKEYRNDPNSPERLENLRNERSKFR